MLDEIHHSFDEEGPWGADLIAGTGGEGWLQSTGQSCSGFPTTVRKEGLLKLEAQENFSLLNLIKNTSRLKKKLHTATAPKGL